MSHILRKFHAQRSRSALFSIVLLVTLLLLQSLMTVPVLARRVAGPHPAPLAPAGLGDPHELEVFLDGVIGKQMRVDHIPGVAVAVVKDDHLLFAKGYGAADLRAGKPVNPQRTLFRVASVSKLFTATAVLQLAEQGKLDLHTDVNTYLKTFQIPATYPEPITLADLLTHTAGFEARDTGMEAAHTTDTLQPLGQLLAEHMPARVRPPGEVTAYSNYGYALAGYIVEEVSGLPFAQYVEQHIFQPLGMRSSTFRQPLEARLSADLSKGYTYSNGQYHPDPFVTIAPSPAGAMSATATDMAQFMIAQLQGGRLRNQRILQEATVKAMQTQQFTNDPRTLSGMAYGFEEQTLNGQRVLVHPGGGGDFYSLLALLPEQHVGVFVAYNSAGGATALSLFTTYSGMLQAFLDHYYPALHVSLPPPPVGSAHRISQISGAYWGTDRSETTWEKLYDSLVWGVNVRVAGNGRIEISYLLGPLASEIYGPSLTFTEVAPWVFRQIDGPETVVFRPDADSGGMRMLRSSFPVMAFDQVAWYATPAFTLALTIACLLIFLSVLLLWVLRLIRRPTRHGGPDPQVGQTSAKLPCSRSGVLLNIASRLALALSALNVLLVLGILLFLFQQLTGAPPDYYYGVPSLLTVLFALALVSAVLTVGVVILAVPVWLQQSWSVRRRLLYSLVSLATLALTWQLVYWNLLGCRA